MGQDYEPTNFESAEAVLEVLKKTVHQFNDFRTGDQKQNMWLEFYVDLLFTVSATLWETTQAVSVAYKSPVCLSNVSFPSAPLARENNL